MPHMKDPFFSSSVIFICEHNKDGAMGLIVNKNFKEQSLRTMFNNLFFDKNSIKSNVGNIYFGGPVMLERGIVLHSSKFSTTGTLSISEDFSITSQKTVLEELKEEKTIPFKLMLGHAGWSAKQLEREIENGDWLIQSTNPDFIFSTGLSKMWRSALKSLGIDLGINSGSGGEA